MLHTVAPVQIVSMNGEPFPGVVSFVSSTSANKKTLEILPVQSRGNTGTLLNLYAESIPFTPAIYIELAL